MGLAFEGSENLRAPLIGGEQWVFGVNSVGNVVDLPIEAEHTTPGISVQDALINDVVESLFTVPERHGVVGTLDAVHHGYGKISKQQFLK